MSRSIETKVARWTFPCVVFGLMSYTLHTFIVRVYGRLLASNDVQLLVIAVSLWCLSIFTYIKLWMTPPGSPSTIETEGINSTTTIQISLCNKQGEPNVCSTCHIKKPDRTHHCRQCNQCILKMDHHCPWIGGCVGQNNQKLFYLFLVYTTLYACWMMTIVWSPLTHAIFDGQPISLRLCWNVYKLYLYTLYKIGVNFYRIGRHQRWIPLLTDVIGWEDYRYIDIHWVITLLLGILFSVVLSGFTGFHSYCLLRNKSTIEHVSTRPYTIRINDPDSKQEQPFITTIQPSERLWDLGIKNNWCSVMGLSPWFWFVPRRVIESNREKRLGPKVYDRIIQEYQRKSSEHSSKQ